MNDFRRVLLDVSKQIDSLTLANMKYLSKDVVPDGRMEKVKTALNLFQALEECGAISSDNAGYLVEMLQSENKRRLAERLQPFVKETSSQYNQPRPSAQNGSSSTFVMSEPQTNIYRTLLKNISNQLTTQEVIDCCYMSQEAENAGLRFQPDINPFKFISFLEQSALISPTNLEYLTECLRGIHRLDLCKIIAQYAAVYHIGGEPQPIHPPAPRQKPVHQPAHAVFTQPVLSQSAHNTVAAVSSYDLPPDQLNYTFDMHHGEKLSVAEQVEDSQGPVQYSIPKSMHQMRIGSKGHFSEDFAEQTKILEQHKKEIDPTDYKKKFQGLEAQSQAMDQAKLEEQPKELEFRKIWQREVEEQKNRLKEELEDREMTINELTQQLEARLYTTRLIESQSEAEKLELQRKVKEYESIIQRNLEEVESLRRERATLQGTVGPVADCYTMSKQPHGIAVIINNFEFHSSEPTDDPLQNRRGSDVDQENLRVTWDYLGYDVRILRNLTASDLTRQLMQIALQSHDSYDSFVCCILSHGYLDGIYGTDSKPVKINDIASLFKGNFCPTLSNKPKLFFIQACRGDNEDEGIIVQKDAKGDAEDAFRHSLPSEADFLFGYATPPGSVSWRSPRYGSWYISKLCEVLVDFSPQQDLLSMLTIVNHRVSEAYTTQGYKQCPAPVTLLRRQVWFFGSPTMH